MSSQSSANDMYLQHDHLLILRQAWQGRLTREATGKGHWVPRLDSKALSTVNELKVEWLVRERYLEHPAVAPGDEWVHLSLTEKGAEVLAANRMDSHRFHDMTVAEARVIQTHLHPAE